MDAINIPFSAPFLHSTWALLPAVNFTYLSCCLKLLPRLLVAAGLDSPDTAALGGTAFQWIITIIGSNISIIGSHITGSNMTLQQILAQALHTFVSLMPE